MTNFNNYDQTPYLNHSMRARIQQDYSTLFDSQHFTWSVTANFNRDTSKHTGYKKLKDWHGMVDQEIYGRNYYKKHRDSRTFFVAIPEYGGLSEHLHYHILATMPLWAEERFEKTAEPTWKTLVKCGSLDVQRIGETDADHERVIGYDLKDIWKDSNHEDIILSTQFSSVH